MTKPTLPEQLESALDELDMAHNTLTIALDDARHSARHSLYLSSLKRILAENDATIRFTKSLLATLALLPAAPPT